MNNSHLNPIHANIIDGFLKDYEAYNQRLFASEREKNLDDAVCFSADKSTYTRVRNCGYIVTADGDLSILRDFRNLKIDWLQEKFPKAQKINDRTLWVPCAAADLELLKEEVELACLPF